MIKCVHQNKKWHKWSIVFRERKILRLVMFGLKVLIHKKKGCKRHIKCDFLCASERHTLLIYIKPTEMCHFQKFSGYNLYHVYLYLLYLLYNTCYGLNVLQYDTCMGVIALEMFTALRPVVKKIYMAFFKAFN